MEAVWRYGASAAGECFETTSAGLRIRDLSGDCWQDLNNQRALLLRTPQFSPSYAFQARVRGFVPADVHAQVGIVAWQDPDNYVRCTSGFRTPRVEAVAERARKTAVAAWNMEPRPGRPAARGLRLEVRPGMIRAFADVKHEYWVEVGSFLRPAAPRAARPFPAIGILAVGGRAHRAPVVCDWVEHPLASFMPDDFDGEGLAPHWRAGQTGPSWGAAKTEITLRNGRLVIIPFSGSDICNRRLRHFPYVAQGVPAGDAWEIEVRIADFPARTPGRWWRAGVVLWQDAGHLVHVSVVCDDGFDHMNLEAIAVGARKPRSNPVFFGGFRPRRRTGAFLRIRKSAPDRYLFRASYDGAEWIELGEIVIALVEPELRLFACGDQTMREWNRHRFPVMFDSLRRIETRGQGKGKQP